MSYNREIFEQKHFILGNSNKKSWKMKEKWTGQEMRLGP